MVNNKPVTSSNSSNKSKSEINNQNVKNDKKIKRGRPKSKVFTEPEIEVKKRGRPKSKVFTEPEIEVKKRGRPKSKVFTEPEIEVKKKVKRGRKTKDEFAELTSKVYEIVIEHGKEGILQSELWKKLDLSSREGSRLAIKLEKRKIVERKKLLEGGRWTYKLIPVKFPIKTTSIEHIPCITCPDEERCSGDETLPGVVTPFDCLLIENWALKEHEKLMENQKSIKIKLSE